MKNREIMSEIKTEKNKLRGAFPGNFDNKLSGSAPYGTPNQYYAIGQDEEVIKRFKVFLRSGAIFSIPYSVLPIYKLDGEKLLIVSHEVKVSVYGRNLGPVEDYLSEESLLWIKESPSGKDDGKAKVFISTIYVKGSGLGKIPDQDDD